MASGLRQRVATALLLAALVVAILFWLPPGVAVTAVMVVVAAGAWEWAGLAGIAAQSGRIAYAAAVMLCVAFAWLLATPAMQALLWCSAAWWLAATAWVVLAPGTGGRASTAIAGFLVLVPAAVGLGRIAELVPDGQLLLLFLLVLVAAADVGAYFGGRTLRPPQAGAARESQQDLGRLLVRRRGGWLRCSRRRVAARRAAAALGRSLSAGRTRVGGRRPRREHVQAQGGPRRTAAGCCPATAASSTASTACRPQARCSCSGLQLIGVARLMRVAVLGSTGSIGVSTLDVLGPPPGPLLGRGAGGGQQRCAPARAVPAASTARGGAAVAGGGCPARRRTACRRRCRPRCGSAAPRSTTVSRARTWTAVMAAIVGAAGLPSTLAAARAGKRVLLANKESLVVAGPLAARGGARGRRHPDPDRQRAQRRSSSACRPGWRPGAGAAGCGASCSPRRAGRSCARRPPTSPRVTPEQACAHPRWNMGRKISVDSATLMNKGLELIEACLLFGMEPARVEVVVHPAEHRALAGRVRGRLDPRPARQSGHAHADRPCARLAGADRLRCTITRFGGGWRASISKPPTSTASRRCAWRGRRRRRAARHRRSLNAANEVAVAAFLAGRLGFQGIPRLIEGVLERHRNEPATRLDAVLEADRWARELAESMLARAAAAGA